MFKRMALVVGGSGLVGRALMRELRAGEVACLGTYANHARDSLRALDITNAEQVRDCFVQVRPGRVFLTAALTHVDYCEDHRDEAFKINVEGTRIIVREAQTSGAQLIFFSTEYIFNGEAGPYDEEARPSPLSVYGQTKLEAEKIVKESVEDALVLRTTVVYGWQPDSKNFAMQIFQRVCAGEKITVPDDQIGTPTLVEYLAGISIRLADMGVSGIVNVVGKDLMSRAKFARALVDAYGGNPDLVVPVSTQSLNQRAPRPLRGGLRTEKLARLIGSEAISLEEAMRRLRRQCKKGVASL